MNENNFELKKYSNKNTEKIIIPDKILINDSKIKTQYLINIKGIEIYFPYQPYEIQIIYMEKIIESLNNKKIAALESPTGTGKTLCLLCSTLAWIKFMREKNKKKIRIFYSTRTHSQITNIIKELKKTIYLPITSILSSRENSCVNYNIKNNIKSLSSLNTKCKINKLKCNFYQNVKNIQFLSYNCIDIEEICSFGNRNKFCPYYYEKDKSFNSDIIFLPYNYIIDKDIKDTLNISFEDSILIIDEAHNIDKVLEESSSFELKNNSLYDMIEELNKILSIKKEEEKNNNKNKKFFQFSEEEIYKEINIIQNIKNNIESITSVLKGEVYPNKGKVLSSNEFFSLFIQYKIKNEQMKIEDMFFNKNKVKKNFEGITPKNIDKHYSFLYNLKEEYLKIYDEDSLLNPLVKFLDLIKYLFFNSENLKSFLFYVYDTMNEFQNRKENIRILKIFCFDSSFGFKKIINENPYNIILTSGTLSPIEVLEFNLKTPIELKLENKHVIDLKKSKFEIIKSINYKGKKIIFQFDNSNRQNIEMINCLGKTILNYVKSLKKGGILIFFPSFNYLNICYSNWLSSKIIEEISKYKKVNIDNKRDKNFINNFILNNNKNSILFSVVRGSISEGIDFKDDIARIVICIGIPYANFIEDKIKLKMIYLNKLYKENKDKKLNLISGQKWYKIDAIQSVNQTLGRVLRHKNDFGMMICIDSRFDEDNIKNLFSKWMNDILEIVNIDDSYFNNIEKFFDKMENEFENKSFNDGKVKIEYESCFDKQNKILDYFNFKKDDFNYNDNNNINISNFKDKNGFINIKELNKQKNKKNKLQFDLQEFTNFKLNNILGKKRKEDLKETNQNIIKNELIKNYISQNIINKKEKKENIILNQIENDTESENSNNINDNKIINNFLKNRKNYDNKLNSINSNAELKLQNEELKIKKNNDKIIEIDKENELIKSIQNDLDNNIYIVEINQELNCPICLEKENKNMYFSISKCNHIICNKCWSKWLKEKMECPLCKKKCRIQTLKKIKKI